MPYQKHQLQDAQNSTAIQNIAGVVVTSPQFVALVNEAQRRLARRGDWYGMIQTARFVFQGSSVTWPQYVGTILGARSCHSRGIRPKNQWYSFTGSFCHDHRGWSRDLVLQDAGQACIYNPIIGAGAGVYVQFIVEKAEDFGKTITIYGTSIGNQPLMQRNSSGAWVSGLTLVAGASLAQTPVLITGIDSIIKDPMQGQSRLYQFDPVANVTQDIGLYAPGETRPSWRQSLILNYRNRWTNPAAPTAPLYNEIDVLVKMAFIEAVNPADFLLLDNLDALKMAIQAIKCEESGDKAGGLAYFTSAISELNFEDRDKMPDNNTPIYVDATMARPLHNPI